MRKRFTNFLKKEAKIDRNQKGYVDCFDQCKNELCNKPILQYPDFEKECVLHTDSSNIAIGAKKKEANFPIAYRTLNNSDINYSKLR